MKNIAFAFPMQYRTIALATIIALLAWTLGLPAMIHNANAAALEDFTDTLSDSDLGVDSIHTITFTTTNAMTAGQAFRIYFDETGAAFDFTGVTATDLVSVSSVGFHPVEACAADTDEIDLTVDTVNDYIEGTVCAGDTVPAGTITFVLDGANRINNPGVADSYVVSVQGTGATPIADTGDTRVAIIDDVTVTADVDTIFTFSINGVAGGVTVNDDITTTYASTTATAVPFGTIAPGSVNAKLMAQELRVDTNALNGFSVSVFANTTLTSGNGATIDAFIDSAETALATNWVSPAATLGVDTTWGHWGLTSDDNVVNNVPADKWGNAEALYAGNFINNPVEVFYHDAPVEYLKGGMGIGSTTVAYKVEISNMQEAAKDYTATLTYIATPVF